MFRYKMTIFFRTFGFEYLEDTVNKGMLIRGVINNYCSIPLSTVVIVYYEVIVKSASVWNGFIFYLGEFLFSFFYGFCVHRFLLFT